MPATSSASRTTPPHRSSTTSKSSNGNCRSTCWNFSVSRRCRARRTTAYPKYLAETAVNQVRWIWLYLRLRRLYLRINHDPDRLRYTDFAMAAAADDAAETR